MIHDYKCVPGTAIVGVDAFTHEYDPMYCKPVISTSIGREASVSKALTSWSRGTGTSCNATGLRPDFNFFAFGRLRPHILNGLEECNFGLQLRWEGGRVGEAGLRFAFVGWAGDCEGEDGIFNLEIDTDGHVSIRDIRENYRRH